MYNRLACAICATTVLDEVVAFGPQPFANGFSCPERREQLTVLQCSSCGHLQLQELVEPEVLFDGYVYRANVQPELFAELADSITRRVNVGPGDTVLDIGANDGSLLAAFPSHVAKLAVDPASPKSAGDRVWQDYWKPGVASEVLDLGGPVKVVTMTNTFAHLDNLHQAVGLVAAVLAVDGYFVIQVPWARDLLVHNYYDTIYHEHKHYFFVDALVSLMQQHWLSVSHVDYLPEVHGGTLRVWVSRELENVDASVEYLIMLESLVETGWFRDTIKSHTESLRDLLGDDEYWAYGASAKGVMLLNMADLKPARVYDDTVGKQGERVPGRGVSVWKPELREIKDWPKTILITAWNYADRIAGRLRQSGFGGRLVVPFPVPRVFTNT